MNHGSAFTGIGAAELAAAKLGWNNVFSCENNEFTSRVTKYWFQTSKHYDDIRTTDFRIWRGFIDIFTAGFPCQPFSLAGSRSGANDDRYYWPETFRAIKQSRPRWFIGENVLGITSMVFTPQKVRMESEELVSKKNHYRILEGEGILNRICKNLEDINYSVQTFVIPALAIGAPHRRDRVFIVAHANENTSRSSQTRRAIKNKGWKNLNQSRKWRKKAKQHIRSRSFLQSITYTNCNGYKPETKLGGYIFKKTQSEKIEEKWERFRNESWGNDAKRFVTHTTCEQSFTKWNRIKKSTCKKKQRKFRRICSKKENSLDANTNGKRLWRKSHRERISRQLTEKSKKDYWENFPSQSPICNGNDGFPGKLDSRAVFGEKYKGRKSIYKKWYEEAIKSGGNAIVHQVLLEIFQMIKAVDKELQLK